MSILLGTLCLNELEWLPRLYEQHRNWPGLTKWVFVEAADRTFATCNPQLVSKDGLSTDSTTEFLESLAKQDDRVLHIKYGFADHPDPALCKIAARDQYWKVADLVRPEFVVSADGDEFYTHDDQGRLVEYMRRQPAYTGFTFPRREIWRPPSIANGPLFRYEVVGGFWGIPCCHWWRWSPGAGHRGCHNTPQDADGSYLNDRLIQLHKDPTAPQMIHCGYAAKASSRLPKVKYYEVRGEAVDPERRWYTASRALWAGWQVGDTLPKGAKVVEYTGPVPECFRE